MAARPALRPGPGAGTPAGPQARRRSDQRSVHLRSRPSRRQRAGHHCPVQRTVARTTAVERVSHRAMLGDRDLGDGTGRPDPLPVLTLPTGWVPHTGRSPMGSVGDGMRPRDHRVGLLPYSSSISCDPAAAPRRRSGTAPTSGPSSASPWPSRSWPGWTAAGGTWMNAPSTILTSGSPQGPPPDGTSSPSCPGPASSASSATSRFR